MYAAKYIYLFDCLYIYFIVQFHSREMKLVALSLVLFGSKRA